MKRLLSLLALLVALTTVPVAIISCADDEATPGSATPRPPQPEEPEEEDPLAPTLTATVRNYQAKLTAYHFNYHSTDPYGNPAILSAAITVGDEVVKQLKKKARGLVIYNRVSAFQEDDSPTGGEQTAEKILAGSGLIIISADHYGFGATADKHQAYGIGIPNAQSSVDAFLAAKKLLPKLGFTWDNKILFNIGYSQGGQTALAVVRVITEQHPDLKITHTITGGGTYDLCESYRQFIQRDYSDHPATIVAVLLAFNEYFHLGIPHANIFKEPLLSHIDDWFYSKEYSVGTLDRLIGYIPASDYLTEEMCDLESPTAQKFMAAFQQEDLCSGWTPLQDEHITLVHNKSDLTVPVANAELFYAFAHDGQGLSNLKMEVKDWGSQFGQSAHETGGIWFALNSINKISSTLGIFPWVDVFSLDVF